MKKMIKDFEMFPSGSYGYNLREPKTEEDVKQLIKEMFIHKSHNKRGKK